MRELRLELPAASLLQQLLCKPVNGTTVGAFRMEKKVYSALLDGFFL